MHVYIGTKMIKAMPMNRKEYNDYRGWPIPADEEASDEGYLVEYMDGPGNHPNHDGYISWSPKKQFDEAYLDLGLIEGRPAYQQRVIGERAELNKKYTALTEFLPTLGFHSLPGEEQIRLSRQLLCMKEYLAILDARIQAFR